MIPLTSQKAHTKNQQLTPKLFCKVKCSSWNIQHNVPVGTLSRFHIQIRPQVTPVTPTVGLIPQVSPRPADESRRESHISPRRLHKNVTPVPRAAAAAQL